MSLTTTRTLTPVKITTGGTLDVVDRLGVGGVAEVYRAIRRRPGRTPEIVALKRLRREVMDNAFFADRFMAEVDLVQMLRHRNLVGGYEVGSFDGQPYVIMDFVDGKDLGTVVRTLAAAGGTLEHSYGVYVVQELLAGLEHFHTLKSPRGTPLKAVHRDVTPDNVLLSYDGDVRLTDFGIALLEGIESTGADEEAAGKLGYLSPEQVQRHQLDHRSDLFAVGCMLYEITVGRNPFAPARGESETAALARVVEGRFVRPTKIDETYPEDLEAVLLKALDKRPAKRFANAGEFREALVDLAFVRADEKAQLSRFLRDTFWKDYRDMRLDVR